MKKIKHKIMSAVAVGALAFGFGASTSEAAMKTIHTDSVKVTSKIDFKGSTFKSNGGNLQIVIPGHKVTKKTSTNPRLYVILYKKGKNGKKESVNTWTDYGKYLSKTYTMRMSNAPKATMWLEYDADYTGNFKAKVVD